MTAQYAPVGDSPHIALDMSVEPSLTDTNACNDGDENEISTSTLTEETDAALLKPYKGASSRAQAEITPTPHSYRADIDGIRCIAVAAVVFFHAYRHLFPGGFVGVDIFFVISGYLITRIIFRQHRCQTFTYADFYSRRIRRIFPSLLLVMTSTLILGCIWLRVINLEAMASTLIAGTIFGANIQIMTNKGGYFDPDVDTNPLLHLWSLGVEEQFYIIWPFLAGIVIRSARRVGFTMLFLFIGLSFGLNIGLISLDQKFSFYFPLSRFWQMAVGSVLAYVSIQSPAQLPEYSQSGVMKYCDMIASSVGLCLIILGFIFVNEDSVFPGWWSLLPTIGAALLIHAGPETPFNKYILGSRPFVFIGKVSYPLYLWHWPLLVYANELYPDVNHKPFWAEPYIMVVLALILSIGTFYLVENKVRYNKSLYVSPLLLVIMTIFLIMGIIVLSKASFFSLQEMNLRPSDPVMPPERESLNGFHNKSASEPLNISRGPRKAPPTLDKVRNAVGNDMYPPPHFTPIPQDSPYASKFEGYILNPGQQNTIVVLGDSHAKMVSHRFVKLFQDAQKTNDTFPTVVYKTRNGTPALPCHPDFASNINLIKKTLPDAVLIIINWPRYIRPGGAASDPLHSTLLCCRDAYVDNCSYQSPKDADEILRLFFETVTELTSLGIHPFVATINPEGKQYSPRLMYNADSLIPSNIQPVSMSQFRLQHKELIQKVENGTIIANGTVIDFAENMCWNDVCEVLDVYGNPIMRDYHHFRPFFARDYVDVIDKIVSSVK